MEKKIIILSGEMMERGDLGYFVIDPNSIRLHKDRLILDYDHNEEEILGYVDNIRVEENKLVGDATIESVREGDRASEVIARLESNTPYEISPTVMLDEVDVTVEKVQDGDIEYNIYRNVPIRGVSICPFGTDRLTTVLNVFGGKNPMKKRNRKMVKMAADEVLEDAVVETEVVDEVVDEVVAEEPTYDAYPLLEEFIGEFGFERGVEYFRRGYDIDQAREADYAELKAARLAAEIDDAGVVDEVGIVDDAVPEANAQEAEVEAAQDAVDAEVEKVLDQNTGLKANIVMARAIRALTKEITKLKAVSVRGGSAVRTGQGKRIPLTAMERFAAAAKNKRHR